MHLLICHDFHDWRGDDFLTLLVRLVSWEAFSCFPWFGMARMTVSQNMMVAWWAKDCEDALRVYDLSACQGPTALNMEGESRGVDKVDLDRRLWPHSLLYFFFLKQCYFQLHFTHRHEITPLTYASTRMPTKDMLTVWVPFIYCSGTARQGHGIYYGGKFLVLVSWINMDQI